MRTLGYFHLAQRSIFQRNNGNGNNKPVKEIEGSRSSSNIGTKDLWQRYFISE